MVIHRLYNHSEAISCHRSPEAFVDRRSEYVPRTEIYGTWPKRRDVPVGASPALVYEAT